MEPKIGIIVCGFDGDRQFIPNPYIQSVRYSKGLPLIIPVVRSDRLLSEYIQLCDGFLFCGGEDITPLLSGEDPCPWYGGTDVTVDLFHIRLMRQILRTRKPVLAISPGRISRWRPEKPSTICRKLHHGVKRATASALNAEV